MRRVLRLGVRVYAVVLLEAGLAGHAVERICAEINVIADSSRIGHGEHAVIPFRAVLCDSLDTAEDADRVCGFFGNRLRLFYPVACQDEGIGLGIKFLRAEREIIVCYRDIIRVDIKVFIKLDLDLHIGLAADAFSQLEHNVPCRYIIQIAARDHLEQRDKLLGYLNRLHVKAEDVGNIHFLLGVRYIVCDIVRRSGVGNLTLPSQRPVATGHIIKVKYSGSGCIKADFYRRGRNGIVFRKHCRDTQDTHSAFLFADYAEAFHCCRCVIAQAEVYIIRVDDDLIAIVLRLERKRSGITIDRVDFAL